MSDITYERTIKGFRYKDTITGLVFFAEDIHRDRWGEAAREGRHRPERASTGLGRPRLQRPGDAQHSHQLSREAD